MRWLRGLSLLILCLLLQVAHTNALPPSQTPERNSTPESASAQIGSENQRRQEDRKAAAQNVAVANQVDPAQTKAEREQLDQQIRIQRRVARFTKALVIVG